MSRYWAEGRTESGHASSTLVLTERHGLFATVFICIGHTLALSNKVGVARDRAFMSKQQLPASGQNRVSRNYVPPSSLVSMDQHSGYCMATSIHELPASGQKHALWYYMPPMVTCLHGSTQWVGPCRPFDLHISLCFFGAAHRQPTSRHCHSRAKAYVLPHRSAHDPRPEQTQRSVWLPRPCPKLLSWKRRRFIMTAGPCS